MANELILEREALRASSHARRCSCGALGAGIVVLGLASSGRRAAGTAARAADLISQVDAGTTGGLRGRESITRL